MLGIKVHMPELDFEGQKLAEILQYVILGLFGISGFIWGYICQSFEQTFYVVAAGSIIASLVTLPPWAVFRSHPLPFQPAVKATVISNTPSTSKGKSKKTKSN